MADAELFLLRLRENWPPRFSPVEEDALDVAFVKASQRMCRGPPFTAGHGRELRNPSLEIRDNLRHVLMHVHRPVNGNA